MTAKRSWNRLGWLPIVERELRVSARQRGMYWGRMLLVIIALLTLAIAIFKLRDEPIQSLGHVFFRDAMLLMMLQSLFAGVGMLDCIAREKREGTLGLLFLTSLGGVDVVVGKMTAGSLRAIYRLLVFLPVIAITFLLGGVEQGTYVVAAIACLSVSFFSLCLAVLCSAVARSYWAAFGLWLGGMLLLCFGAPLLLTAADLVSRHMGAGSIGMDYRLILFISPIMMCFNLVSPMGWSGGTLTDAILVGVMVQSLFSVLFFLGACRLVVRAGKDKEVKIRITQTPLAKINGSGFSKSAVQWKLKDQSPMRWLITRYRSTKVIAVTFVMSGLALLSLGWLMTPEEERSLALGVSLVGAGHLAVVLWMAAEAAAWVVKLRQSGELELLLTTPIAIQEFWRGYQQALLRKSIIPVSLLLFGYWCFATSTTGRFYEVSDWVLRLVGIMCVGLLLPLNMLAAGWTGAWFGSIAKNELTAAVAVVGLIIGTVVMTLALIYLMVEMTIGMPSLWEYANRGAYRYYYHSDNHSNALCFLLFCAIPWFLIVRASIIFFSWSRTQCQTLRWAVQVEDLNHQSWLRYARVFGQSLYRRPKPMLEGAR